MEEKSRGIQDLPIEVIAHILEFCEPRDICNALETCKKLYEALALESVWRTKIAREYTITNLKNDEWSYREIYQQLLHPYGYMIGLWHCNQTCYGAIFKVEFDPVDVCLRCYEILPPQNPLVENPVRTKLLFIVGPKSRQVKCCLSHIGSVTRCGLGFAFKCQAREQEHYDVDSPASSFSDWRQAEYGDENFMSELPFGSELRFKKFIASKAREHNFIASPLILNSTCDISNALIKPGLFKGTYSVHGIEFVHLSYDSDGEEITVRKITGDENVPAGEITNMADLTRPMVLTRAQQSAESLLGIDIPDMEPGFDLTNLPRQPFQVPNGWCSFGNATPDYCMARFHGQGQVAATGFEEPIMTPGHCVLFDNDTFGFVWLELRAFGLYCRIKEYEF